MEDPPKEDPPSSPGKISVRIVPPVFSMKIGQEGYSARVFNENLLISNHLQRPEGHRARGPEAQFDSTLWRPFGLGVVTHPATHQGEAGDDILLPGA